MTWSHWPIKLLPCTPSSHTGLLGGERGRGRGRGTWGRRECEHLPANPARCADSLSLRLLHTPASPDSLISVHPSALSSRITSPVRPRGPEAQGMSSPRSARLKPTAFTAAYQSLPLAMINLQQDCSHSCVLLCTVVCTRTLRNHCGHRCLLWVPQAHGTRPGKQKLSIHVC